LERSPRLSSHPGRAGGRIGVEGKEMTRQQSGTPVTFGDLEIEPIERTLVRVENACGVLVAVALKEPVAGTLRSPRGTWRVDLTSLDRDGVTDDREAGR
jgi:hypothetical protein